MIIKPKTNTYTKTVFSTGTPKEPPKEEDGAAVLGGVAGRRNQVAQASPSELPNLLSFIKENYLSEFPILQQQALERLNNELESIKAEINNYASEFNEKKYRTATFQFIELSSNWKQPEYFLASSSFSRRLGEVPRTDSIIPFLDLLKSLKRRESTLTSSVDGKVLDLDKTIEDIEKYTKKIYYCQNTLSEPIKQIDELTLSEASEVISHETSGLQKIFNIFMWKK